MQSHKDLCSDGSELALMLCLHFGILNGLPIYYNIIKDVTQEQPDKRDE